MINPISIQTKEKAINSSLKISRKKIVVFITSTPINDKNTELLVKVAFMGEIYKLNSLSKPGSITLTKEVI